ncbi:MAG: hypothetical protein HZB39_11735 [Planctomycetes bacterium]|nr:hypothetical protein [Planctomycetota bacterium]
MKLPVREVTVFKDGHAYLLREMPLDPKAGGRVVLDELPIPVLGTFWPYASGGARLVSAKAGRETVAEDLPAVDLRQLARANLGKDVVIVDVNQERIEGKLLAMPTRSRDGTAAEGELLLVSTSSGTRAVPMMLVRDLEVRGDLQTTVRVEQLRERLTLEVQGGGEGASVGVMYVQRGLRWIPSYRLDIDGAGKASVQLQASLVNDLIDLDRATVHLVIGVPKFEFEGLVDPISLQQEVAAVSVRLPSFSVNSNLLSNSLMTQSAGYVGGDQGAQAPDTNVGSGESNEDLFVFTLRDITLKKGERLAVPISTFELAYRDVYTLDVPFAPPMEIRQGLQSDRMLELARQLAAPKAMHVLRLKNLSTAPLTTAPALVLSKGRALAQGRMRYTPIGAETDLEINTAIEIHVESEEHETGRVANARFFDNNQYGHIELAGKIVLHNRKRSAVEIEVSRRVLGIADAVEQAGSMQQLDLANLWSGEVRPGWWAWWSWPYWWFRFNGFAEFRWNVKLEPGASTTLDSSWHYFWR